MTDFYIKQNDTGPAIQITLLDSDGEAFDYTGATSVRFHMANKSGTVVVDADMTQTTPASGIVTYNWDAADTVTAGAFTAEVEVTLSNGIIRTFPNTTNFNITIATELA